MTEREHTQEPAEGAEQPGGEQATDHTPHPDQPAEGADQGRPGADSPDT